MKTELKTLLCLAAAFGAISAAQADPVALRVGNTSAQAFTFIPFDIGVAKGFFAKYGVETEKIDFSGSAKLHQGMIADAVDIGLGAGTDLQFVAKGAPELGVAQMAGPPYFLGVIVPYDFAGTELRRFEGQEDRHLHGRLADPVVDAAHGAEQGLATDRHHPRAGGLGVAG